MPPGIHPGACRRGQERGDTFEICARCGGVCKISPLQGGHKGAGGGVQGAPVREIRAAQREQYACGGERAFDLCRAPGAACAAGARAEAGVLCGGTGADPRGVHKALPRGGTRRAHGKRILNPFWAQKGRAPASLGSFLQNIFNQGFVFAPIFAYNCV